MTPPPHTDEELRRLALDDLDLVPTDEQIWRQDVVRLLDRIKELEADKARAVQVGSNYVSDSIDKDAEVRALKARVEVQSEALEPFADAADAYPISTPDQTSIDDKHVNISVGALRRARELVENADD